jgi:hypothetical protein
MLKVLASALLLISSTAFASDPSDLIEKFYSVKIESNPETKISCICQIGQEPVTQKWFFKKGCQTWLKEQVNCNEKRILDKSSSSSKDYTGIELDSQFKDGILKLGYVGHWAGKAESYNYFKEVVEPTLKKYNVSIFWDNSACSGLETPEDVLKLFYIQKDIDQNAADLFYKYNIQTLELKLRFAEIDNNKKLQAELSAKIENLKKNKPSPIANYSVLYRANQVTSIGIWDRKFNPKSNLWAMADLQSRQITYPECNEFKAQSCTGTFQKNEVGTCRNDSGELEKIACCKKPNSAFGSEWMAKEECSEQ